MDEKPASITKLHIAFDVAVTLLVIAAAIEALDFPPLARTFPLSVGLLAAVFGMIVVAIDGRAYTRDAATAAAPPPEAEDFPRRGVISVCVWMFGYIIGVALIGMVAASAVFLMSSLIIQGKVRPFWAAVLTVVLVGWLLLIADLIGLRMPPSFIDLFRLVFGNVNVI
jgi:hypothetical protein